MDPPPFSCDLWYTTNLRSRGDGPGRFLGGGVLLGKPPLTRRWTCPASACPPRARQTSAHAEMDRRARLEECPRYPNLRSRGDGPSSSPCSSKVAAKPPLTRRWTPGDLRGAPHVHQTSAHAEMDLSFVFEKHRPNPNLRSRGDGPSFHVVDARGSSKPPLTRRWTESRLSVSESSLQTSAHAEMDPRWWWRRSRSCSNLRSRGDGPKRAEMWWRMKDKPPLTRRWTYVTFSL